jgi:hypothetical protein
MNVLRTWINCNLTSLVKTPNLMGCNDLRTLLSAGIHIGVRRRCVEGSSRADAPPRARRQVASKRPG